MRSNTTTVSIDGLDGVGKSTVVRELNRQICESGFSSKILRSPVAPLSPIQDQMEEIGGLPTMLFYLSGNVLSLDKEFLSSFDCDFILFDRHIYSTLAYFYSEKWREIYDACYTNICKPDFSFFISTAEDQTRTTRLEKRGRRGKGDHLSPQETHRIELRMRAFDMIEIDNTSDDNGISAAKSILQNLPMSLVPNIPN